MQAASSMNVETAAKTCIEQSRFFYSNFIRTLNALERKGGDRKASLPSHGNIRGPEEHR